MSELTDRLREKLKEINVIFRGDFLLKSGKSSSVYFDIKSAYGHSNILNLICDCFYEQMDKRTTCLAASGYGGIPPASALASKYGIKLAMVRDDLKDHGKIKDIDGYVPTIDDRVTIVDDVLTSGIGLTKTIGAIRKTQAKILAGHVVILKKDVDLGIDLRYLLRSEDLFETIKVQSDI